MKTLYLFLVLIFIEKINSTELPDCWDDEINNFDKGIPCCNGYECVNVSDSIVSSIQIKIQNKIVYLTKEKLIPECDKPIALKLKKIKKEKGIAEGFTSYIFEFQNIRTRKPIELECQMSDSMKTCSDSIGHYIVSYSIPKEPKIKWNKNVCKSIYNKKGIYRDDKGTNFSELG